MQRELSRLHSYEKLKHDIDVNALTVSITVWKNAHSMEINQLFCIDVNTSPLNHSKLGNGTFEIVFLQTIAFTSHKTNGSEYLHSSKLLSIDALWKSKSSRYKPWIHRKSVCYVAYICPRNSFSSYSCNVSYTLGIYII